MPSRRTRLFPTPDEAEIAFYEAFERADLAAMMAVWGESDDVVCIHPTGPRLQGFEAVRQSWAQIFTNGSRLRIRTADVRKFDGDTVAVRSVVELLTAPGGQGTPQSVLATNVYALGDGGWRLMVHHASPVPEAAAPAEETPAASHTLH
ncbi:MAG TPA: nuclear transport factor 2 family protein [Usitatibacter sp.]|nr:nuclear transport factor 2 family protein [Usitatibacter sp.]